MNADEIVALVRQRIESRYRRLVFVHEELARLNAMARLEPAAKQKTSPQQKNQTAPEELSENHPDPAVKNSPPNTLANRSFEDFVFSRINFALYKKINTEEFVLLFDKGLADYEDVFYQKAFSLSREEVQETIKKAYVKAGPVYLCKKTSPLLLSIMRTVHTSLDFAPLLGNDDIPDKEQIKAVAGVLDGLVIRHDDGMETKLFIPKEDEKNPPIQGQPLLCGTFHPLGKACTIALI